VFFYAVGGKKTQAVPKHYDSIAIIELL